MASNRDEVKAEIEKAFADVPYPGDDRIAYSTTAFECPEINADFRGKHWKEVPREVLQYHHDDLPLFSSAGCQYYLPAYLFAALDDFWDLREFVSIHLTPEDTHEAMQSFHERFDGLTPAQKRCIKAFFEYLQDEESDRYWAPTALKLYWGRDWK